MIRLRHATLVVGALVLALGGACSSGDGPTSTTTTVPSAATSPAGGTSPTGGTPGTEATPPGTTRDAPPAVTVATDGTTTDMRVGTYCWGGICADAIGIITPVEPMSAPAGAELAFDGDAFDEHVSAANLQLWPVPAEPAAQGDDWRAWVPETDATVLDIVDGHATLPSDLEPGTYLVSLFLSFDGGGDASYGILIAIGG